MSSDLTTKLNQSLFREVAVRAALLAYARQYPCPGDLLPDGNLTGCSCGGCDGKCDCPTCGVFANPSPAITEIEDGLRSAKKDNLSGFYEWQIEKHSAEYEIEFRGNEIKSLQSQLKVAMKELECNPRKCTQYRGCKIHNCSTQNCYCDKKRQEVFSTLSQSGKESHDSL